MNKGVLSMRARHILIYGGKMVNTIKIKHGNTIPTIDNLSPYELGYVHNGELYINNNGIIVQLTSKLDENLNDLIKDGKLTISQFEIIPKSVYKQEKILVTNDDNQLLYREPKEILSDIKGYSIYGGIIDGNVEINGSFITNKDVEIKGKLITQQEAIFNNSLTIVGSLLANGIIILKEGVNYGYENPNDANIPGIKGQIYFLLPGE